MVLFDTLFCGTCEALETMRAWGLISATVDAAVLVVAVLLIFGYSLDLPLWIAANISINLALKYIIGEERPGPCGCGPGMPSVHAQLAAFLLVVYIYWELRRWRNHVCFIVWHFLLATVLVSLVFVSRGVLGYHTVIQIVVGAVIGFTLGILYVIVHQSLRRRKK